MSKLKETVLLRTLPLDFRSVNNVWTLWTLYVFFFQFYSYFNLFLFYGVLIFPSLYLCLFLMSAVLFLLTFCSWKVLYKYSWSQCMEYMKGKPFILWQQEYGQWISFSYDSCDNHYKAMNEREAENISPIKYDPVSQESVGGVWCNSILLKGNWSWSSKLHSVRTDI